jgi:hypothetical protein
MNDMSSVIVPKSDQINADDLQGRSMMITIAAVQLKGGQEQPVSIYFEGSDKAFRPCKSMCRVLVQGWGLDANQYVGKSLTLYCDPTVKFGPLAVGGIRISHMSDIDGPMTMALTATKGVKKAYKVLPLVAEQKADKAADGVRTLIARISSVDVKNLGNVIDDPVVVKQRAWLSANRPELAAQVDTAIAALAPASADEDPFEGRTPSDHGESTNLTDALAELKKIELAVDIDPMVNAILPLLSDEDGQTLRDAATERREQLAA